jgi:anaerobic carbon-monoxide dehydrogenase, CODH/ACS complex subunit epsilon
MKAQAFHTVNILTGTKSGTIIKDVDQCAELIKKAKRPLLVIGGKVLDEKGLTKPLGEYAIDMADAVDMPICATAHSIKGLIEMGWMPESTLDFVEILNFLKKSDWMGVGKEGNHDLVIFMGIRSDLLERGLSTLKHYAPHLKTISLCNEVMPNADYSLPNWTKGKKWNGFLGGLIEALNDQTGQA